MLPGRRVLTNWGIWEWKQNWVFMRRWVYSIVPTFSYQTSTQAGTLGRARTPCESSSSSCSGNWAKHCRYCGLRCCPRHPPRWSRARRRTRRCAPWRSDTSGSTEVILKVPRAAALVTATSSRRYSLNCLRGEARKLVIMGNCARQVACLRIKLPLIVLLVNNSNKHLYSFEAAQASLANINLTFEDMNPLDGAPQLLSIQLHALNPFYLIFSSPFM